MMIEGKENMLVYHTRQQQQQQQQQQQPRQHAINHPRPTQQMTHFFGGLLGWICRPDGGWSGSRVIRSKRTKSTKSRSTFCAVLALVSKNSQPKLRAIARPSSLDTSLS
jgi:spore germination cell wall hydrolase CwlJ-like protein